MESIIAMTEILSFIGLLCSLQNYFKIEITNSCGRTNLYLQKTQYSHPAPDKSHALESIHGSATIQVSNTTDLELFFRTLQILRMRDTIWDEKISKKEKRYFDKMKRLDVEKKGNL